MQTKETILITGGADGLGKETAKILAKNYRVMIIDINEAKIKKTEKELGVCGYKCDISKPEEIKEIVKKIIKECGKIDVLINNAGLWMEGEINSVNPAEISKVCAVNLAGAMMLVAEIVPYMKKKKSGFIINIISQSAFSPQSKRSVYSATKWGMTGFTKCLQEELPKYGIKTSGVYPGAIKTGFFGKYGNKKGNKYMIDSKQVAILIKMMIEADKEIVFPEIGIKHYLR